LSQSARISSVSAAMELLIPKPLPHYRFEANSLFADPYVLVGFRIGYKSGDGNEVFFEANNITNRIYAATVERVGDARVEGAKSFNPGNGC